MRVIDSHTEGQPTRVIVDGGPDLGSGSLAERRELLARDHDDLRQKTILEPKCSNAMVGALLCQSPNPYCAAGVIFFNNTGYLGMCGHGTIGLAVTLAYLGKLSLGSHLIDTPSGVVRVDLNGPNDATVENVPSYCFRKSVELTVDGLGKVSGSIAWGGNWFFLADSTPCILSRENIPQLTDAASKIKRALVEQSIFGADGGEIDHVEFFGPGQSSDVNSRNFVLCPGLAYDRSPCGTGTSAKIACLAENGQLAPGEDWIQESIMGSRFRGSYRPDEEGRVIPSIAGTSYVFADAKLVHQSDDPFARGFG
ncbi:proline racemase family protein [Sphingorhabdus sp. EL138]|jgi:4-hydroxyproline epimerase|uniref:proline racemase family protein n=1 Tax=Sphingorhabdus sp. EL138 TaxID=2073156 RepID=UPI000D68BAC8|nr:proline racemase family protein [Sphingorhabdus sp. EL138]